MDGAPTAACFICYNSSNRFYENVSLLQSKHSERSISAILILILGEELASEWCATNTACFECVDKINDYDEAFEKMSSIELELKHIHQNIRVKIEKEHNSVNGVNFDDGAGDYSTNHPDDLFDEKPPLQSFVMHMSVESHMSDANCNDNAKSKFDCDQCGLTLPTTAGLKIHIALVHKDPEQANCSICHKMFPNKHALETHTMSVACRPAIVSCTICHESFLGTTYLKAHMMKHYRTGNLEPPFRCEFCGVELDEHKELRVHKMHHLNRPHYQCLECEYIGRTMGLLKQHMRSHKNQNRCNICGEGFVNAVSLQMHVKRHDSDLNVEHRRTEHEHPTKDYTKCVERFASDDNLSAPSCAPVEPKRSATIKCDHCDQVFLTRQGISGHMRHVHNSENKPPPGECVHCGMDFGDAETMVEHKRLHLNRPDFQCIQCDRVLTRKQTLKIHMRTHTGGGDRPHKCNECGLRFAQTESLNAHLKYAHVSRTSEIACDQCGEKFSSQKEILKHSWQFHKQPVRLKCSICRKTFPNSLLLEKHAAFCIPMDLQCQICQKFYIRPRNLKAHMEKHEQAVQKKPNAKCDYCGIILSDLELLSDHKRQHQNRPDFQCLECEFTGNTNNQLKAHMRIHTKKLRYQCDVCGKAFYDSSTLHSHLKYHNNALNVECYMCKVRTLTVGEMQVHMRRHTGEKPFKCSECGKRFARNSNLSAHFRLHFRATSTMCAGRKMDSYKWGY